MTRPTVLLTFVCTAAAAVFGPASAVPAPRQQPQPDEGAAADTAAGGFSATVLWSVLDDCLGGEDVADTAAVCLKSKALTALDRALSKPAVAIADGVSLAARTGKSLRFDGRQTDKTNWAALDAAEGADRKNALLDDMLASRVDELVSTRTIVMDEPAGQEGRGKKKDKTMKKAMMMMGMMAAAVMGPMAMKMIALIAMKALIVGKIALVLSLIMLFKKLMMSQQQQGGGGHSSSHGHESESTSYGSYARTMQIDAHNMAYSGQKK